MADSDPPKVVPTTFRVNRLCRRATVADDQSSAISRTRMPAPMNGGHRFIPVRSRRGVIVIPLIGLFG